MGHSRTGVLCSVNTGSPAPVPARAALWDHCRVNVCALHQAASNRWESRPRKMTLKGKKTIRRIERAVLRQAESGGRRKTKARQNVPATGSQSSPAKGQVAGFQNCADTFSNCSVPSLVCLLSTSQDHVWLPLPANVPGRTWSNRAF